MWHAAVVILGILTWPSLIRSASYSQELLRAATALKHLYLADQLLEFHKNLTEIESITYNEKKVGEWLAESLEVQGYTVEKQYVDREAGRFNLYAYPGKTGEANVLVSSHIDTVPPFYPYKHENETISGRGTVDDKGSVAAQVVAVNQLLSKGEINEEDVAFLFVVGEETGGDGMRKANDLDLKPKAIVFGEPTEGKLVSGHKGNDALQIKAKGKSAHSGYPWLGRSANEVLVRALAALMEIGPNLPKSDKYGFTTINIGKIEGGVASNVVSESASANMAIRIAAGEPEMIEHEITKAIHLAVESFLDEGMVPEDVIELQFSPSSYGPIDIDADVPGFETMTVNYGTDIPWLRKTVDGQMRYLYGPGSIMVAHSDHEALTEKELFNAVEDYQKIILFALDRS